MTLFLLALQALSIVLCLQCFMISTATANTIVTSSVDINTLYDIYTATNGDSWTYNNPLSTGVGIPWNFSSSVNPCANGSLWFGVTCSYDSDSSQTFAVVSTLHLDVTGLVGTIPTSIGNFEHIIGLNMGRNSLRSTIPFEIGRLTNLTFLNFFSNDFTGSIPIVLGSLVQLTYLDIGQNSLIGPIPESIYDISTIKMMYLGKNSLSGTLSPSIANWADSLVHLDADTNFLTGSIPDTLTNFKQMIYLDLTLNWMNGRYELVIYISKDL